MRIAPARFVTRDGRRYEIRTPRASEAGRVLDHAWSIHGHEREAWLDVGQLRRDLARLAAAPADFFLAACAGDEVIGTLSVEGGRLGVSVRRGWRRQGVGSRLVGLAVAQARGPLQLEVLPNNRAAIGLYEAAGFRTVGHAGVRLRMERPESVP